MRSSFAIQRVLAWKCLAISHADSRSEVCSEGSVEVRLALSGSDVHSDDCYAGIDEPVGESDFTSLSRSAEAVGVNGR